MSESPTVYTAHDIPDLFNALPTLLGFRPSDSLIAVATSGPRRRFGFRMRLDMPAARHVDAAARVVAGHLRTNHADGAIVLALTHQQAIARDLIAAIEANLGDIVPIVIARSDGQRYWVDLPGFPDEGIVYETSDHHVSIVEAIAAGQQILPDRQALVDRYAAVSGPRRRWLRAAVLTEAARIDTTLAGTEAHDLLRVAMCEVQPVIDRVLAGEMIDDGQALLVSVWVCHPEVRDAVREQITGVNAGRFHVALVGMCRSVVPPFEPAILGLTSFAAWLSGNGTEALIAAERAVGADPHHPLATLMLDLITCGVSPERLEELSDRMDTDLREAG